jgi:serine/threonine protein kinase
MRPLGQGRFGTVYRHSMSTVIKVGTVTSREIDLHCNLQHPHIVACLGIGMYHGNSGLVLQYCDGGTLWLYAQSRGSLRIVSNFMRQILSALVYLHEEQGIMHRDIKLGNILLHRGHAQLSDFGLAIRASHSRRRVGTLKYMAPEVAAKQQYDHRADVYSWAKAWAQVSKIRKSDYPAGLRLLWTEQNRRPRSIDVLKNWSLYCENAGTDPAAAHSGANSPALGQT